MENDFNRNEGEVYKPSKDFARANKSSQEVEALDYLNKILRGEISAVEVYAKAIEKFPQDAARFELASFRQDHQHNVDELSRLLKVQGEEPSTASGAWGTTVGGLMSIATFLGDKSAVGLLIEGEEHGLNQYSDVLNYPVPDSIRTKISETFLPQSRINIGKLRGIANVI